MELESIGHPGLWIAFLAFVLGMLALDLGVFHRKAHAISLREAAIWSAVWIGLAGVFNVWLWSSHGSVKGMEFLTGYVIEKSLSVDNIFVFAVIFSAFAVPQAYQHRVLFWGILGALVMRALFIVVGGAMLERFHWMIWVFGAFLVLTGLKLMWRDDSKVDPAQNPIVRMVRRFVPMTQGYEGDRFFVRQGGRWLATPLFLALIAVEATDVIFAVDSIPAIFAITRDPFIVFTSNIFAILGLRSLYFLLAGILDRFRYLKFGLALVLVFVGAKMVMLEVYKVPVGISLMIIVGILGGSIVASLLRRKDDPPATPVTKPQPGQA
ncbi:MAG: TerC family protein [Planctomycetes bacterium]|nr:TerC family protein [Planctomycetota bacterium]MCC7172042.1 TerC family protein [Planctomycetota bacterium]